ncbi:BZ3501_MvSof-1269-A2-R1_Chr2-1g04333 [Microbotryum saponariae]|nr:BZ3501_MvSof-1269-A2-R1_Chr2-1g04333 [Microbotryum saponariae]
MWLPSIIQLLPEPRCHLQTFTSRLLYDNLHAARRAEGSRDVGIASPFFSLLLFTPYPSHLIPSPPRARDVRSGRRGSSATNTGSRNACRMQHSYEFDNFLQHVLFECQPSSCFFTVSCGRIDFVRLRIRVIGTLNKTASGRVNCGSPSRGRSSTARFGSWQEIRSNAFPLFHGSVRWSDRRVGRGSEAMPSRYSTSSPAQIVDACIMNGDFWGDLSTDMRLLAAADRMTETERAKAIRR